MMAPSIALPTGPYDLGSCGVARATFEARLDALRAVMRAEGLAHAVVYGNTFDHAALIWFANFTPKLGPALLLVPLQGAPRMLFAGGPGMKPSAQRLTWVEDVAALRGLGRELADWLKEAKPARVGLVAPEAISFGDLRALETGAGGALVPLAPAMEPPIEAVAASARLLQAVADHAFAKTGVGQDLLSLILSAERLAYGMGAQDLRWRVAREPWGRPVTLPDHPQTIDGALPVSLAVRRGGYWASGDFVLGDIAACAAKVRAQLEGAQGGAAYFNRVAWPPPGAATGELAQISVEAMGARWSGLRRGASEWLFLPPGL